MNKRADRRDLQLRRLKRALKLVEMAAMSGHVAYSAGAMLPGVEILIKHAIRDQGPHVEAMRREP